MHTLKYFFIITFLFGWVVCTGIFTNLSLGYDFVPTSLILGSGILFLLCGFTIAYIMITGDYMNSDNVNIYNNGWRRNNDIP